MKTSIFFALATIFLVAAATATVVTYTQCTDKALCLSGCESVQLPSGQCQAYTKNNKTNSQILQCDPEQRVCGVLSTYSDSSCQYLQASQGFVCNECDGNDSNGRIMCMANQAKEYLAVQRCAQNGCGSDCVTFANITAGSCFPNKDKNGRITGYMKYDGTALCTAVYRKAWSNNADCSGAADQWGLLPVNSCIGGARLQCNYGV